MTQNISVLCAYVSIFDFPKLKKSPVENCSHPEVTVIMKWQSLTPNLLEEHISALRAALFRVWLTGGFDSTFHITIRSGRIFLQKKVRRVRKESPSGEIFLVKVEVSWGSEVRSHTLLVWQLCCIIPKSCFGCTGTDWMTVMLFRDMYLVSVEDKKKSYERFSYL